MKDSKSEVLDFWFVETIPVQWFQKNEAFDDIVRERFLSVYENACNDAYSDWTTSPDGCLALCVILDQFPRNMFRNSPKAFATDGKALDIAIAAVENGFDQVLPVIKRRFIYLPFEHSENLTDQKKSVGFFASMIDDDPLGHDYALRHLDVIEKFGRFPHRNEILGRVSTDAELEYLSRPGSGF